MGGKVALIEFKIILESASATLFCFPSMCLTSVVNSETYASGITAWKTTDKWPWQMQMLMACDQ